MTLSAGTRLGPYEVLSPLGVGGMGEVWRARDTRLGREVAIKVLPAGLASDPSRLKRFEKEARAASALNHPNIVTIYDIGAADSVSYIAMELVAGKTLRELLFGGTLPVKRLLPIAAQIADGLARAHEAGIVHRDLKPENVMVTKDGLVKILDFGLAKLTQVDSGSGGASHLPTETGTSPGVVLGTVGYMSPEQASGAVVDFRSDQFSFGSILYEMATGKRAFQKKTAVDTLSAILNEEPEPVGAVNPQAPTPLRWIVERCLAKDPEARYASTKDLARELATIRDRLPEASGVSGARAARKRRRPGVLAAVGLAALLAVLAAGIQVGRQIAKTTPPDFKRLTFQRGNVGAARFTRDGQTIVYTATSNGDPWRLFSTRRGSPESSPLPLPDGSFIRGISPSGELAILAGGKLSRVPLSGGAPREVLDGIGWADWAPDGSSFLVIRRTDDGKARLEYPAGKVLYETAGEIGWGRISPGGDQAAFLEAPITGDELGSSVAVVDREGRKRTLASGFTSSGGLVWSRDGREVWFTAGREGVAGALYAVSLSGKERVVLRTPVPMTILDVAADGSVLVDQHLPTMRIIGLAPGESRERDLSWLDYSFASDLSSDGRTLLFDESGDGAGKSYRLYLRQTDGSPPMLLGEGSFGALSSDGAWALSLVGKHQQQIVLLPTKSGESKPVPLDGVTPQYAWLFPDDKRLLVAGHAPGHGQRLYVKDLAGGRPRPVGPEGIRHSIGTKPISPDGEWIFAIGADGMISVYGVENSQAKLLPGAKPGDRPLQWTADGHSIYVMNRKGTVFSVFRIEVATGRRDLWKEVVPPDTAGSFGISSFLIAADGRSYVYSYRRTLADLYLVSGLK